MTTRPTLEGQVVTRTWLPRRPSRPLILLNTIYRDSTWTMLNNSLTYPSDGPVRDERTQPGLDLQAYQDASTLSSPWIGSTSSFSTIHWVPRRASPDMNGDPVTLAWTLYQSTETPRRWPLSTTGSRPMSTRSPRWLPRASGRRTMASATGAPRYRRQRRTAGSAAPAPAGTTPASARFLS